MSLFDAICHGFSVMSLGGFSTHDASIAWFHSPLIEFVLIVFMVLAAINFSTHFMALRKGDPGAYRRDPEARWLIVWLGVSLAAITLVVWSAGLYPTLVTTFRHTAFNVVALATTCGFVTADYSLWPIFAPMWMLFLTCVICQHRLDRWRHQAVPRADHDQAGAPRDVRAGASGVQWLR